MGVVERAERDLARDEPWLARDRLVAALRDRPADPELLDLLGATYVRMSDLPAAGAVWFLSARADADVAGALEAFRARYAKPHARAAVLHVREPLSAYPPAAQERLRALLAEVTAQGWTWELGARPRQAELPRRVRTPVRHRVPDRREALLERLQPAFWTVVAGASVLLWGLGLLTALRWVF